jgi:hypothetical protein
MGKKLVRPHLNQLNLDVVVHTYSGRLNGRLAVHDCPGINMRLYLKNKLKIKWDGGLAQVLACKHNGPEFKTLYCPSP